MKKGTNAVLVLGEEKYKLNHFKITELSDYFCFEVEMNGKLPELTDEAYSGRIIVNGDALWYFPWLWFKNNSSNIIASANSAIFCPFGLSDEDEERYNAICLTIASDICYDMSAIVWLNLLMVFGDWLKSKSIPQYKHYMSLAQEIKEAESLDGNKSSLKDNT